MENEPRCYGNLLLTIYEAHTHILVTGWKSLTLSCVFSVDVVITRRWLTYCLGFEGELSCMFDHRQKKQNNNNHTALRRLGRQDIAGIFYCSDSCFFSLLILCHFCSRMESLLMTGRPLQKSELRTEGFLLNICCPYFSLTETQ